MQNSNEATPPENIQIWPKADAQTCKQELWKNLLGLIWGRIKTKHEPGMISLYFLKTFC